MPMQRIVWWAAFGVIVASLRLAAQDLKPPPAVDQEAINMAVEKGARWIIEKIKEEVPRYYNSYGGMVGANRKFHDPNTVDELALYALLHAGVDPKHPEVVKLLGVISGRPPERTYVTSIRAQALQKYDPVMLKDYIRSAAQFLIDNQCQQGFWGYGQPVNLPTLSKAVVTPDPRMTYSGPKGASSDDDPFLKTAKPGGWQGNTTSRPHISLSRRGWCQGTDNSNSQYALLGLAACMAAGYYPPADLLTLAEQWWTHQQNEDGGWNYRNYQRPAGVKSVGMTSYLSMTAGGVSSLCIILRAKGNVELAKDRRVQAGLKWLAKYLDFGSDRLSLGGSTWRYYAIYSAERAGALAGTEWFGDHPWYKEGAEWLLANQRKDGSWGGYEMAKGAVAGRQPAATQPKWNDDGRRIADTAWAILFLRRATRGITKTLSPDFHKTIARDQQKSAPAGLAKAAPAGEPKETPANPPKGTATDAPESTPANPPAMAPADEPKPNPADLPMTPPAVEPKAPLPELKNGPRPDGNQEMAPERNEGRSPKAKDGEAAPPR
jgi:hypothetical protein